MINQIPNQYTFFITKFIKNKIFSYSMDLREIKRELDDLSNIETDMKSFQDNWVMPFLSNSHKTIKIKRDSPFQILKDLNKTEQEDLNHKIETFYKNFDNLNSGKVTNDKLRVLTRAVIEMKLIDFQVKTINLRESSMLQAKLQHLYHKILKDDFNSLSIAINEVKEFDHNLHVIESIYQEVNDYLCQKLPLEDSLAIMQLPHQRYLKKLKVTSNKRKELLKQLGTHFLDLQKKMNLLGRAS